MQGDVGAPAGPRSLHPTPSIPSTLHTLDSKEISALLQVVSLTTLHVLVAPVLLHALFQVYLRCIPVLMHGASDAQNTLQVWLRFYAIAAGVASLLLIGWYTDGVLVVGVASGDTTLLIVWKTIEHQVTTLVIVGINIWGLVAGMTLLCRQTDTKSLRFSMWWHRRMVLRLGILIVGVFGIGVVWANFETKSDGGTSGTSCAAAAAQDWCVKPWTEP